MPVVVAVAVGLVLGARAVGPRRFSFWWTFRPFCAFAGCVSTWFVLSLVSYIAVAVVRAKLGDHADTWTDIASAAGVQASLRRAKSDRGSTLLLGLLPDVFQWTNHFVTQRVEEWAEGLPVPDELVKAAAKVKPKDRGLPSNADRTALATWRDQQVADLLGSGSKAEEARIDLISLIVAGYPKYLHRKPRSM